MTNPPIQFSSSGLVEPYCFSSFSRLNLDIVAALTGFLPGTFSGFVKSETEPPVDQRDNVWLKLGAGGAPGQWFIYYNGAWVWPNPEAPSSQIRRIFEGTEADIWSYDGGDGSDPAVVAPGYAVGAMWERDVNYNGRSPMGAGDIPTSNPAKALAISEDFGAGARLITEQETPPHTHKVWPADNGDGNADKNWSHIDPGGGGCGGVTSTLIAPYDGCPLKTLLLAETPSYSSTQQTAPIVHPVRGVYFIKRTARTAYKS